MAKKKRTAKQLRNDKRLGRMAKAKGKSRSKAPKVKTMAKRKRRSSKKQQQSGFNIGKLAPLLAPVAYGFLRERVSDALAKIPLMQKIPATQFTDEGVMLAAMWGLKKAGVGKRGVMNSVLKSGKTIELARIGETLADMQAKKKDSGAAF